MSMKKVAVKFVRSSSVLHALVRRIKAKLYQSSTPQRAAVTIALAAELVEFKRLSKFRNFKSASALLKSIPFDDLTVSDRILVVRCLYGAGSGVQADDLLERVACAVQGAGGVKVRQFAELAECVRISGLKYEYKLQLIQGLQETLELFYPGSIGEQFRLNLTLFRLRDGVEGGADPVAYIDLSNFPESMLRDCAAAFPLLISYGYHSMVYTYLERCAAVLSEPDLLLVRLLVKYLPEWFDGRVEALQCVVNAHVSDINLLRALHEQRLAGVHFDQAYRRCLDGVISGFSGFDLHKKDSVLGFLMDCDLWAEAASFSRSSEIPDYVLSKLTARGFCYLLDGDFGASYDCFMRVVEEDPADKMAAGGLRFVLPRLGFGVRAILDVRANIGHGLKSAGRRASRGGSEYTTSEMMAGNYLGALRAKRKSKSWVSLGHIVGDKLHNYSLLPLSGGGVDLFLIADEGVGDEIRTAQFYSRLLVAFDSVTMTCDPRLLGIFSRSFPSVKFLPTKRTRRITSGREDTRNARLVGVHETVSKYLDEFSYSEMLKATHVTFAQNLMFNYFAGAISRPAVGGYLKWERSSRVNGARENLRVGILWRSHLMVGMRKLMYLRLEDFAPLTQLEGVEVWSIQHAMTEAETQTCRDLGINLLDDVDLFNDFEGMAGCLLGLDLLIGISSVPMELGAALGIETWMLGFSPENYYLRTAGGKTEVDQLTLNSTVVAPPWIDFTEPQDVCVREVFDEVKRRLAPRLASARTGSQVCEG